MRPNTFYSDYHRKPPPPPPPPPPLFLLGRALWGKVQESGMEALICLPSLLWTRSDPMMWTSLCPQLPLPTFASFGEGPGICCQEIGHWQSAITYSNHFPCRVVSIVIFPYTTPTKTYNVHTYMLLLAHFLFVDFSTCF